MNKLQKNIFAFKKNAREVIFGKILYFYKILLLKFSLVNKQNLNKLEEKIANFSVKKRALFLLTLGLVNLFASSPIGFVWILFFSFPVFFILLYQSSANKNFKQFLFDIVFFITGFTISQFNWLVAPLFTEWKFMPLIPIAIIAPAVVFVIINCIVFIPFYLISSFCSENKNYNKIINFYNDNLGVKIILFAICYILGEYIRGEYLFGGFQWQLFGHLFCNLFFIQALKIFNIYTYSFVYLIISFALLLIYKANSNFDRKFKLSVFISFLALIFFSFYSLLSNPKKDEFSKTSFVAGVQNNISAQNSLNETAYQKVSRVYRDIQILGKMPQDSLLIMPEASFEILSDNYLQFFKLMGAEIRQQNSLFISGAIFFDKLNNKAYNSIFFADNGGNVIGHYKKKKLVPFGEYIPFRKYLPAFLRPITGDLDYSSEGRSDNVILYRNFPLIFPFICYEIIFSENVKRRLDRINSALYFNKEKVLLNLTNDVWTGGSISPYQHFNMARMTAVRANASLIRLSNNGISAIIDSNGRILQSTPLNSKAVLLSKI